MPLGAPYLCGQAGAASTDTLVIPINVDVARSSQVLGATFVFVYIQLDNDSTSTIISVFDDAPVDLSDGYSLCIFADGLNHYDPSSGPAGGFIVDALVHGVNSITVTLDVPTAFIQAAAIAWTGIGAAPGSGWPLTPLDPAMTWWPGALDAVAEAPVGAPTGSSAGPQWTYDSGSNVVMGSPPGTGGADSNWDWASGELALYFVEKNNASADPGAWTWADGTLIPLVNWHVATGLGGPKAWMWEAIAYGSVSVGAAGPSMAGSLADASSLVGGGGNGFALFGGEGPFCTTPPPSGNPCFNHRLSVGPNAGSTGAAQGFPAFQSRFPAGPDAGTSGAAQAFPSFAHRFRRDF